jgi:uncharacterized protein (TIGR02246 family)
MMRTGCRLLWSVTMTLALAGILRAQEEGGNDVEGAKQVLAAFSQAWEEGDVAAIASLWNADGDMITATGQRATGRSEIEALLSRDLAGFMKGTRFRVEIDEVKPLANGVMLIDGSASLAGVLAPDGKKMPPLGHLIVAVVVKTNGSWKIQALRIFVPVPSPEE